MRDHNDASKGAVALTARPKRNPSGSAVPAVGGFPIRCRRGHGHEMQARGDPLGVGAARCDCSWGALASADSRDRPAKRLASRLTSRAALLASRRLPRSLETGTCLHRGTRVDLLLGIIDKLGRADGPGMLTFSIPLMRSFAETASALQEGLAALPQDETDPDWDWAPMGVLLESGRDDSPEFIEIYAPESLYGPDWQRVLYYEELPRLLAEHSPYRVGLTVNMGGPGGVEELVILLADGGHVDAWYAPIGRRPDGVRKLGTWDRLPEDHRKWAWWEFIEHVHRVLANSILVLGEDADATET